MALLERTRAFHEDIEQYEKAIIKQLEAKPKTHKDRVLQQHRVAALLNHAVDRSKALHELYADEDGAMKEEIAGMRGKDAFKGFYERVKETVQYHARNPGVQVQNGPNLEAEMDVQVAFSGEEVFGKFFDLHELYARWNNLPQRKEKRVDYTEYLSKLPTALQEISEAEKKRGGGRAYSRYVADIGGYLEGFLRRTQPLVDLAEVLAEAKKDFEAAWAAGTVPGWPPAAAAEANGAAGAAAAQPRPLDLSKYRAAEDLQPLGMERLREALDALGLKCGGTLQQRVDRLWSVRGVDPDKIDAKLRAKGKKGGGGGGGPAANGAAKKRHRDGESKVAAANGENGAAEHLGDGSAAPEDANGGGNGGGSGGDPRRELAWAEAKVTALLALLSDVLGATRRQVEKKQTLTVEERDAEIREEEEGVLPEIDEAGDGEDSDDDGPIYNPLNLPLGWDGKPIPYWLYKLHGLGVEFKCEICGGFSYMGRRNFDRHFQEFRHAHGMRCLGIPNTKHFHDITLIQDAQDLYNKIRHQLDREQWHPEAEEEYEDADGNVLKRRTYEDLARQGLL